MGFVSFNVDGKNTFVVQVAHSAGGQAPICVYDATPKRDSEETVVVPHEIPVPWLVHMKSSVHQVEDVQIKLWHV